jgi:outer membrane protein
VRLYPLSLYLLLSSMLPLFLFGCATGGVQPIPESGSLPATASATAQAATSSASGAGLPDLETVSELELSLEESILLMLQNNRGLAIEQLNPVIAGAYAQIERGRFDPELFASWQQDEEQSSEVSRSTEDVFSVKGTDERASVGLRKEFASGTDVEADIAHQRSISSRTPEQQEARLGLSVTQSLLRGFGPGVNLISVRQAELEVEASTYELRGYTEALMAECEIAYWRYVLAREEIAIFERSLEVAIRQRDDIVEQIEVGALAENDAAAARAEVARREQDLIEAQSNLENRRLRLLRLIDPNALHRSDLELTTASSPHREALPIEDIADRVALAARMRPDLNEARLRHEQNRLETVRTRNGLLPRLDLFIDLGKTGYADAFTDSFQNLEDDTYEVTGGIRLSHYLGNRAARGRDLAAREDWEQSRLSIENLEDLVRLDVHLAINEVERYRRQITASAVTRAFQEQSLQAEEERFNVGAGTALLVAQAQRDLLASQIAEIDAIVQYRIALVDLFLAEGSLLERRGISLGN